MESSELLKPLINNRKWLNIVGVFAIGAGILYIVSIVGILICWIPIWLGVLLFQTSSNLEKFELSGNEEDATLGLEKLVLFFKFVAIVLIVSLVISLFIFVFAAGRIGPFSGWIGPF